MNREFLISAYPDCGYKHEGKHYKKVMLVSDGTWELEGPIDKIYKWAEKMQAFKKDHVDVELNISVHNSYGDESVCIEVSGYKELTEKELQQYQTALRDNKDRDRKQKEAMYERLKKELEK